MSTAFAVLNLAFYAAVFVGISALTGNPDSGCLFYLGAAFGVGMQAFYKSIDY